MCRKKITETQTCACVTSARPRSCSRMVTALVRRFVGCQTACGRQHSSWLRLAGAARSGTTGRAGARPGMGLGPGLGARTAPSTAVSVRVAPPGSTLQLPVLGIQRQGHVCVEKRISRLKQIWNFLSIKSNQHRLTTFAQPEVLLYENRARLECFRSGEPSDRLRNLWCSGGARCGPGLPWSRCARVSQWQLLLLTILPVECLELDHSPSTSRGSACAKCAASVAGGTPNNDDAKAFGAASASAGTAGARNRDSTCLGAARAN